MALTTTQIYTIHPTDVRAEPRDDEDLSYVWFAEQSSETRYVTISRTYPGEELYLERDDQKWCAYQGITSISIDHSEILICLDDDAAKSLGGISRILVQWDDIADPLKQRVVVVFKQLLSQTGVPLLIASL